MTVTEGVWLLIANIVAWLVLHFAVSALCFNIPLRYFLKDTAFLRIGQWEGNGKVWNRLFFVKKWKRYLIDGSSIVKKSYNKSRLHGWGREDLEVFAAETKRAELTHWLLMLPAPFFSCGTLVGQAGSSSPMRSSQTCRLSSRSGTTEGGSRPSWVFVRQGK